jgi:hypothetical protein
LIESDRHLLRPFHIHGEQQFLVTFGFDRQGSQQIIAFVKANNHMLKVTEEILLPYLELSPPLSLSILE